MDPIPESLKETEKRAASRRLCTEARSEAMEQTACNFSGQNVIDIRNSNIEKISGIMDLRTMRVQNTKYVVETKNETKNSTCMTKISKAAPETSTVLNEKMDSEATSEPDKDSVCNVIDPVTNNFGMIERIKELNTKVNNETVMGNQPTESSSKVENLKNIFTYAEEDSEITIHSPFQNKEKDSKSTDQSTGAVSGVENSVSGATSNTDEDSKMAEQTSEFIHIIENIVEVLGIIAGIIKRIETTPGTDTCNVDETLNKKTDASCAIEKSVTTLQQNTEDTEEFMSFEAALDTVIENMSTKINPATDNSECLETWNLEDLVLSGGKIDQEKTLNEIIIDITPNRRTSAIVNETEKTQILITDTKRLRNASGRKRKRSLPPISEMVMHSLKSLKKKNGASFEDIQKFIEENYLVTVQGLWKYNVNMFLQNCVKNGMLVETDGADAEKRFKFKEPTNKPIAEKKFKTNLEVLNQLFSKMKKR